MRLFLFALGVALANPAWAADQCIVTAAVEYPMAPLRLQGPTGFCYAFTSRALLESLEGRFTPEKQLSVLDVLGIHNGALVGGGYPNEVLGRIHDYREVALESCAPFTESVVNDQKRKQTIYTSWDCVNRAEKPCNASDEAAKMKVELRIKTPLDEIIRAYSKKNFAFFLKDIDLPKDCEKSRVRLPDYKVRREPGPFKTPEALRKIIQDAFRSVAMPVIVDLCSRPVKGDLKECGPHSIVVSGMRQRCCGKACWLEYRIVDSAGYFKEWESEAKLSSHVDAFDYYADIVWLEKR